MKTLCAAVSQRLGPPKDSVSYHTDTCLSMFNGVLLTIAMKWNQPRCPSTDIMKMCYTYK